MDAVADRDLFIEFAAACALFGVHFSRIAEDLILWSSAEFKFVSLPDAFCTGSSLMPQKKNPDSCELLRGKSARLQGNLHTLLTLVKGLPMTYNRDLQEDKPPVFDSFDQASICADVLEGTVRGMSFNRDRCAGGVGSRAPRHRPCGLPGLAGRPVPRGPPRRRRRRGARGKKGCALPDLTTAEVRRFTRLRQGLGVGLRPRPRLSMRKGTGMPGPRAGRPAVRPLEKDSSGSVLIRALNPEWPRSASSRPGGQPDRRRGGDRAAGGGGEGAGRERPRRRRHPRGRRIRACGPGAHPGRGQWARACRPEDARTALERHATSKIADAADLDRLTTFGFRGEALPSIASVSRFTLQTREAGQESGTEIAVNAGRWSTKRRAAGRSGPAIDVEHLFEPVPARRKFLKTDRTESAHIVNCVRLYALACPSVSFALYEDGREVFRSPECPSLADRVAEIFGRQAAEGLIPIDVAEEGMRLTGLIGRPGSGRATRHDMVAFVNSRPVDSRTLNGALIESYRESIPRGAIRSRLCSSSAGRPRST
jgi:DNA mismatch repair protein MutL